MRRDFCHGLTGLLALLMLWIVPSSARADYVYTFSATEVRTGIGPNTFSFTETSLITTTGAFAFIPFTVGSATFTSGFFDASSDCFSFATSTAADCNTNGVSFFATLPGAISVGTFSEILPTLCHSIQTTDPCELIDSLTISQSTATPEPSSLMLLGTGVLGVAGVLRRRWLS